MPSSRCGPRSTAQPDRWAGPPAVGRPAGAVSEKPVTAVGGVLLERPRWLVCGQSVPAQIGCQDPEVVQQCGKPAPPAAVAFDAVQRDQRAPVACPEGVDVQAHAGPRIV